MKLLLLLTVIHAGTIHTFDMILESRVRYKNGVAALLKDLLTTVHACQSLLSVNWARMGGRMSKGRSWNGALKMRTGIE